MVFIKESSDFDDVFRSAEARRINYDELFHVLLVRYEDKTPQVQTLRHLVNEWFVDNTLGKENKLWGIVHDGELWLSLSEIENYFGVIPERAQQVIRSGGTESTPDEDDTRVKIYEISETLYAKLDEAGGFNQLSKIGKFVNIPVPFETTFRTGISKRVASILKDAKQGRISLDETLEFFQYTYDKRTDAEVASVRREAKRWLEQNTQVKYRRLWSMANNQLWLTSKEIQQHFGVDAETARKFLDESQAIIDEYPETPITYYKIDEKKYEELSAYRNKKQLQREASSAETVLPEAPKIKRERRKAGEGRPECFSLARIVEDFGIEESEALRILKDAGTIDLTSQECPLLYKISPEITAQLQNAPKKPSVNSSESSKPEYANKPERQNPDSLAEIVRTPEEPSKVVSLPVRYQGVVETDEGFDITALFEKMPPQLRERVLHKDYVARGEDERVIVETDCFGEFISFYRAQTDRSEKATIAARRNAEKPGIQAEPRNIEPVKNLMDRKGLESYVLSQVKSVPGVPPEKVGNVTAIAIRSVLRDIRGKFSVQYDPEKVEAATGDFISKLELGFGRASPKINGEYTDYNEMYPSRFKSLGEAMEFASAWLRERGIDGDRVVYAARTSKLSEIVRSAKANGKEEYGRDLIVLGLKRNLGNMTSNKEPAPEVQPKERRGRRKKDEYDEIPLTDLIPSDEDSDSRDLETFLREDGSKD